MIKALDELAPGLYSDHTLLYVTEVKFYSSRIETTPETETTAIKNLYTIGDGSGITRSLAQSSASGVIAARSILMKEKIIESDGFLIDYFKRIRRGVYL